MLIFVAGFAPIYGTQILYFIDPVFKTRAEMPAPPDTDRLPVPLSKKVQQAQELLAACLA